MVKVLKYLKEMSEFGNLCCCPFIFMSIFSLCKTQNLPKAKIMIDDLIILSRKNKMLAFNGELTSKPQLAISH